MQLNKIKVTAMLRLRDLNQTELATMTGISRQTICGICRGCACSTRTAEKIAAALKLNVNDLK